MVPARSTRVRVVLRGHDVPVTLHGNGEGPAVLLLPGGAVGAEHCFPDLVEQLPDARVVVHDRLGTGTSPEPPDGVGLESWAEDAVSLLDQLDVDRVVLVGHSLGGALAVRLLADHPDRVAAALLLDPTPLNDAGLCARAARGVALVSRVTRLPVVGRWAERGLVRVSRPKRLTPSARRAFDATFAGDWVGQTARATRRLVADAAAWSSRSVAPVAVPVVLVTADRGAGHRVRRAHTALAEAIGARLELWPGTTHSLHLERPDLVVDSARALLAEVASSRT